MNISRITTNDLTEWEGILDEVYGTGQTDWSVIISKAKTRLIHRLQNDGKHIKKLCTVLNVPTDGTQSSQDTIERLRFVCTLSHSGAGTVVLSGTNSVGGSSESDTTITIGETDANGEFTEVLTDPKYYYSIATTGTVTISEAYLIETKLELPHLLLSLHMAFKWLSQSEGDNWDDKAKKYEMEYEESYQRAVYSYDTDSDGAIDEDEQRSFSIIELKR